MTVVVDVGCARHGGDYSIERLVEEFRPDVLYGFDPAFEAPEGLPDTAGWYGWFDGDTSVSVQRAAAYTYDGTIGFTVAGLGGRIDPDARATTPCVDLARFILDLTLGEAERIILKVDAEGAEYDLLEHLIARRAHERIDLAWIEWHCTQCRRGWIGNHSPECPGDPVGDERRVAIYEQWSGELREWKY